MPTEKKGSNFKQDRDRKSKTKTQSSLAKAAGKALENSVLNSGYATGKIAGEVLKSNGENIKKAFEIGGAVRNEGSMVEGMNRDKKRTVVTDPEGNKVINKKRRDGSTKSTVKFKKENRGSVGGKRRQVDIYK